MDPTLADFLTFVRNVMGVPVLALPDNSPYLTYAFNIACMIVNPVLRCVQVPVPPGISQSWGYYSLAVLNLSGDNLINWAQDVPPSTYFKDLRASGDGGYGVSEFVAGVISAAADNDTSTSIQVSDTLKNLTLSNLQQLKTPYGRMYLSLAQDYGSIWGLT